MSKTDCKVKQRKVYLVCAAMLGLFLTACTGSSETPAEETETVSVQLPEISAPVAGKAYEINETCNVLDTYEQYNIQVPDVQMAEDVMQQGYKGLTFKTHVVAPADDTTSEGGKYDVVDTMEVLITGASPFEIMPQTIEKTVTYKRDASTLEWIKTDETCKQWKVEHKKLGGTAWKMSSQDGDVYIRLRDTIEFFYVNIDKERANEGMVDFNTTMLGAMATVKDGEMILQRIHVQSGTLSATGELTLTVEVYDMEKEAYNEEKIEALLHQYEKIEKADLPFTEEEYKEVAAW